MYLKAYFEPWLATWPAAELARKARPSRRGEQRIAEPTPYRRVLPLTCTLIICTTRRHPSRSLEGLLRRLWRTKKKIRCEPRRCPDLKRKRGTRTSSRVILCLRSLFFQIAAQPAARLAVLIAEQAAILAAQRPAAPLTAQRVAGRSARSP